MGQGLLARANWSLKIKEDFNLLEEIIHHEIYWIPLLIRKLDYAIARGVYFREKRGFIVIIKKKTSILIY